MRFRSVRFQRLPLFDQMIAIFKKQFETIDVFRAIGPSGNIFEREEHLGWIFAKSVRVQLRLIPFARVESHVETVHPVGTINGDKP